MTAVLRDADTRRFVVNGITLSCFEAGPPSGPTIVLAHGFPELAYSWRHQIPVLAEAGYHVLAPDQRGYGASDRPEAITDYDIFHLTGDLAGLLDAVGVDRAVFVGHDWGGLVVWQMPFLQPDRVAGVVGVNTPFIPRLPAAPTAVFRHVGGDSHYILFFQEPGVAEAALPADLRTLFRRLMRRGVPGEDRPAASGANPIETLLNGEPAGDDLLTDAELDVYAATFGRTGFTGGLNWYRNFDRNWELTPDQEGATVDVPCLMVTAAWDPVLTPSMAAGMGAWIADLEMHEIPRCGHWTQQERPGELNRILLDWLGRRFPVEGAAASG